MQGSPVHGARRMAVVVALAAGCLAGSARETAAARLCSRSPLVRLGEQKLADLGHPTGTVDGTVPARHGCVRVWRPTIVKIFAETPTGARVRVYGAY